MKLYFSKETYIQRRAELKKKVNSGLLLFLGNNLVGMNYGDNEYSFRQDSSFLYYFGLDAPGLAAVINIDTDGEMIFGNDPTIDDIVWMGAQPTLKEKSALVGVNETYPLSNLSQYISKAIASGRKIHFLPPYRGDHRVWLQSLLGLKPEEQDAKVSEEFILAVVNMRNHKTEDEIVEIEKAVDVSVDMHVKMMQMVRPGVHEAEVRAAVTAIAQGREGGDNSFPVIATTHGQTLHNHGYIHTAQDGEMFLLDAGAEIGSHYCGDLSSTSPVGDDFTSRQKDIYNICLSAHRAAVDVLAPGVPFREAHLAAATKIAEGMKMLGLMKGSPDEAAHCGAYALFFQCGLGHMMGLDVHDMESLGEKYVGYDIFADPAKASHPTCPVSYNVKSTQFGFKSLRLARPLEPGFVFTIEPGIYFIPELIDRWKAEHKFEDFYCWSEIEKYRNFGGLRNEENYLITSNGARLLGHKKKPMSIEEVLAVRNIG